ncbi:autotransporter assembly complex protein TamA [Caulobacter segnis]|uniref:autotransporter assembly complex protein TamA n=1 Tax=Caulobacter segnis TaxID=88688 RepID=UPI00321F957C
MGRTVFALAAAGAALNAAAFTGARADEPRAAIEGVEDRALREAIVTAVGRADTPPASRFEARRRARDAGENAISVLRSEGYYGHDVEADLAEGDRLAPLVRITPGQRFTFADPKITWVETPPADDVATAAEKAMGLGAGAPGRSADVLGAEGRILATIQKRGYADAQAQPREVIVDHADHTVRPDFRIDAGELVLLGGLDLSSEGRTKLWWIRNLAPWKPGDVYDPEDVAELERRLRDTAVYDSVTVALSPADAKTADGLRPVVVSVADRARRTIELGAGFSTTEGAGLDGRWTRYNRFGRGDTLRITGRLAELEQRLDAEVSLPHWRKPQRTLKVGGAVFHEDTDAYEDTGVGVRSDITRRFGRISFLTVGAAVDASQIADKTDVNGFVVGQERNLLTLTTLAALNWDASDDPLDPRRGWRVEVRGEPTFVTGDDSITYLKTQAQVTGYLPISKQEKTVLAGRAKAGLIVGGRIPSVPGSRRFFAGGGGSIRGYAFQGVGPRLSDNTPQGGLSLLEASFEVRQKITGPWGAVAFIDAGAVGTNEFPKTRDFSAGAGVGIRYDLGFGPIRADIAVPLDKREGDPSFQVYLSIGQSF